MFPVDIIPDSEVAFVTYVDVPEETLEWIKEEISKLANFEHIIFQKASAAIASNCGPGTFGVLYFVKSNRTYNISSLLPKEFSSEAGEESAVYEETAAPRAVEGMDVTGGGVPESDDEQVSEEREPEETEKPWYDRLEGIDGETAIVNSGSEEAFSTVLKIFYDAIGPKSAELRGFYDAQDWENYTIKVHALKSSAKLIGAMDLSDRAFALEMAGKEKNIGFIRENHAAFMEQYEAYKEKLSGLYEKNEEKDGESELPMADGTLMESVYADIAKAAEEMEIDDLEEALGRLEGYGLPEADRQKIDAIREMADIYDYDAVLELLAKD